LLYSTVAEAGGQQPAHDTQSDVPGLERQAAHMIHVLVVAAQFLIYWRRAYRQRNYRSLIAQHSEQMAQRST
jgi:hypothetical protein